MYIEVKLWWSRAKRRLHVAGFTNVPMTNATGYHTWYGASTSKRNISMLDYDVSTIQAMPVL